MYRPDQQHSCCPHYTIRLDSNEFKPSRDHRQTINRFNRYVIGDAYAKEAARLYPKSRDQAKKRDNQFDLTERIHEAEHVQLKTPPGPAHQLVVTLEDNDFTEEKFAVYENYQRVVHKDSPKDINRAGFKRFLCASPLRRETIMSPNGRKQRLGSFHQCYRLDGRLVAIGVLDLLPECVSSVYFLYDEIIHKHAPGKLGGLYEISLAIEEGYRWWYPGFYIHSCPKMRYKMDYSPQYILDPESLAWDPFDRVILDLLDKKSFVSLSLEREKTAGAPTPLLADEDEEIDGEARVDAAELQSDEPVDEEDPWLFNSKMPGILPLSYMVTLDMDHIALRVAEDGPLYETCDLVSWGTKNTDHWPGLKATVAELVAAIGPDLIDQICLDLAPRGRG
ncbi:Fc.00g029430.m01.CDS01 [Cosmosporella sp. VM-42]